MNAQDYLLRQGWAGPGTPLNPNRQRVGGPHGGLGLTKPILVARRKGNEGVGKKTTKDPTNQWWLRGFEDALKGVGPEGAAGAGQSTGVTARTPNALTSELYRFFVRGEGLAGTVGSQSQSQIQGQSQEKKKEEKKGKRKRDDDDEEKSEKKEKKTRKDKDGREESKEERRQRKLEKRLKKERKAEEGVSKRKDKKAKKESKSKPEDNYPTPASTEHDSSGQDEAVKKREKKSKSKSKDKKESKKTKTTSSGDDKESRKSKKTKKDT